MTVSMLKDCCSMCQTIYLLIIKTDFNAPPQLSQETVHN